MVIAGHGIVLAEPMQLAPGLLLTGDLPNFEMQEAADGAGSFADYSAVVTGRPIANFALVIDHPEGREGLAIRAWNALWVFHLLSVAAQGPCCSLYAMAMGKPLSFTAANRTTALQRFPVLTSISKERLVWARDHRLVFDRLVGNRIFSAAMRCYGNAHYLADLDMRIMLLWSGIEGLLSVDSELTRRIALYSSLMFRGTHTEKAAHFDKVKKAYGIRSKAVHGGSASKEDLVTGYTQASEILISLLGQCVELGRVPTTKELDALAFSLTVT